MLNRGAGTHACRLGTHAETLPGQILVYRAPLDAATPRERHLQAHQALRAVLSRLTPAPLDFAVAEKSKPYLPAAPELKFNLSHSHAMALIAVALNVEVGVDIEFVRPMPDSQAIAARFFPPAEAAAFAATPPAQREFDFFRRWTRTEAMLKARGIGLYGAGAELPGEWTVEEIAACPGYAAAVAATAPGMRVLLEDL